MLSGRFVGADKNLVGDVVGDLVGADKNLVGADRNLVGAYEARIGRLSGADKDLSGDVSGSLMYGSCASATLV